MEMFLTCGQYGRGRDTLVARWVRHSTNSLCRRRADWIIPDMESCAVENLDRMVRCEDGGDLRHDSGHVVNRATRRVARALEESIDLADM